MMIMPSNASGWLWHCLARETGLIGHLYSPGGQRGPWPWLPYALDNGVFALWKPETNDFDEVRWMSEGVHAWRKLLAWSVSNTLKPIWAIVPDRPGDSQKTLAKWEQYQREVADAGIPQALAVQDGMTTEDVKSLKRRPDIIAIGGSTEFKWSTVERWCADFPRVHVLRCNSPQKLEYLRKLGAESCDGTGWNRGDVKQTQGLEDFCRRTSFRDLTHISLVPHTRKPRIVKQDDEWI